MTAADARKAVAAQARPERLHFLTNYFKAGPGQYAHGDRFHGLTVPEQREIARRFRTLPPEESIALLRSPWHEERFVALVIWVDQFHRGDRDAQRQLHKRYLRERRWVNHWDLVDASAPTLLGEALRKEKDRSALDHLVTSPSPWDRRMALLATLTFIRSEDYDDTFRLASELLDEKNTLVQKALGWMLREIGQRAPNALLDYLNGHAASLPRNALSVAMQKLTPDEKAAYLVTRPERSRCEPTKPNRNAQ